MDRRTLLLSSGLSLLFGSASLPRLRWARRGSALNRGKVRLALITVEMFMIESILVFAFFLLAPAIHIELPLERRELVVIEMLL